MVSFHVRDEFTRLARAFPRDISILACFPVIPQLNLKGGDDESPRDLIICLFETAFSPEETLLPRAAKSKPFPAMPCFCVMCNGWKVPLQLQLLLGKNF